MVGEILSIDNKAIYIGDRFENDWRCERSNYTIEQILDKNGAKISENFYVELFSIDEEGYFKFL